MVTIIHLSPGSTQPAFYTIRTQYGGPSSLNFPLEFKSGVSNLIDGAVEKKNSILENHLSQKSLSANLLLHWFPE